MSKKAINQQKILCDSMGHALVTIIGAIILATYL